MQKVIKVLQATKVWVLTTYHLSPQAPHTPPQPSLLRRTTTTPTSRPRRRPTPAPLASLTVTLQSTSLSLTLSLMVILCMGLSIRYIQKLFQNCCFILIIDSERCDIHTSQATRSGGGITIFEDSRSFDKKRRTIYSIFTIFLLKFNWDLTWTYSIKSREYSE